MRRLVHVSDLHFGRSDKSVVKGLLKELLIIQPDLVIISGDLTQRAKPREFEEAREFISALKSNGLSCFVIPGNHDIAPIYRPVRRMLNPYKNYREFISSATESYYHDDEIAIASINTVRSMTIDNGVVAQTKLEEVCEWLSGFPASHVKLVVTHHPLYRSPSRLFRKPAWKAKDAISALSQSGVDAFLSGHLHKTSFSRPGVLSIHAGTVSERLRGEPATFNLISIDVPHMTVEKRAWNSSEAVFKRNRATALLIKNKFKTGSRHAQLTKKDASV